MVWCILTTACREEPEGNDPPFPKYSFHLMTKDGNEYLVQTDSLDSGSVDPARGVRPIPARHFYDLVPRKGFYYYVEPKTSTFLKNTVKNGAFRQAGAVKLTGISLVENLTWLSDDSVLVIGYDFRRSVTRYARINVGNMTADEGIVDIPSPAEPFNWVSIGFLRFHNDKVSVGYTYHSSAGPGSFTTSDTMHIDVLSFPGMKSLARYKDTRSTYPGGINTKESYSFTDEKGDFYFIACPGLVGGNHPGKPTAIFRIGSTEERPDPDYFFNISASPVGNHAYGLWYLGKGKAILRSEQKGFYTGISDHWKTPHFQFYLVDLYTREVEKLDLPPDKGSSRQCVLVDNGRVYLTVNPDSGGCYVWRFDPETRALGKKLLFTGETDYILRIDRM